MAMHFVAMCGLSKGGLIDPEGSGYVRQTQPEGHETVAVG